VTAGSVRRTDLCAPKYVRQLYPIHFGGKRYIVGFVAGSAEGRKANVRLSMVW